MYRSHEQQRLSFSHQTEISQKNRLIGRIDRGESIGRSLIGIVILWIFSLATGLLAQGDASLLMARDLSNQNTVSTNQLLTPRKALKAVQRAQNHLSAGRVVEAQKEIAHALDVSPRCALALDIQGAIDFQSGDVEKASREFQQAVESDPSLGSAHLGLAMSLIARDRLEEAVGPVDRAASLLPNSWLVHFEAALTHLGLGDADAALRQVEYAERFSEGNSERQSAAVYIHGMACVSLRDYESARKYFQAAVSSNPNGYFARQALGRLEQLKSLRK